MSTFTSPFTGTVVVPTDVSYYALSFSTNTQLYWPAVVNPTQVPAARIMDCTPSTTGLVILLPQGNQGSVGTDILIRNNGLYDFVITDINSLQSVTVTHGTSRYFYLSDNTTVAGVWQNVQFGTGTSAADAASLQGAGLTTISGQLAVTSNIVEVTSSPVITKNSHNNIIYNLTKEILNILEDQESLTMPAHIKKKINHINKENNILNETTCNGKVP